MLIVNNAMSNNLTPDLSPSSQQTTPLFTAANLAAHQRAMAATSSTTPSQGGWVCGGEMNHRRPAPKPEQWNELIERDPLAADIEKALREAANARQNPGN